MSFTKVVQYDPHAVRRMGQRSLSRDDVRAVLAVGIWSPEPRQSDREPRFSKRAYVRGREAKVTYLENARRLYVITVEWIGDT